MHKSGLQQFSASRIDQIAFDMRNRFFARAASKANGRLMDGKSKYMASLQTTLLKHATVFDFPYNLSSLQVHLVESLVGPINDTDVMSATPSILLSL